MRLTNIARIMLQQRLKAEEGFRPFPYLDSVGTLTVGYGRNLVSRGLTEEEALHLLDNDIYMAEDQIDSAMPWTRELDEVRKAILIDMCTNLGLRGLLKFKKTLQAVKEGRYQDAGVEMLDSLWAKQVGNRAAVLAKAMEGGEWWN